MSKVTVYGMPGSSNVQTVMMALDEMQVPCELRQLPFAEYKRAPYKRELHPFGMVPAIEHGDFKLYETQAILRYVAHAFPGPQLEPGDPHRRARMNQILSIAQAYMPGCISGGNSINFFRTFAAKVGVADEQAIADALPRARTIIVELERLLEGPYFVGELSIADLMIAPVLFVFQQTPEGAAILADAPRLATWLAQLQTRPSARLLRMP